jgi:predicted double-glycine peptidase
LTILDNFTYPWGKLWPGRFLSTTTTYNMTVELNDRSLLSSPGTTIRFTDIWGKGVQLLVSPRLDAPTPAPPIPTTASSSADSHQAAALISGVCILVFALFFQNR